jgi:transcription elongation factor Elf1
METMMFSTNKRAVLSNRDSSLFVLFKCDGCNLNKSVLTVYTDKPERGYLCEYCTKSNLFSSDSK